MKLCTACGETKPIAEFYWTTRKNGEKARHSKCRVCRRAQFKAWAKTGRGKQVKRAGILRRSYGLSEHEYRIMWNAQKGLCAICGKSETRSHHNGTPLSLSIDHCHKTGAARGLLCNKCNAGLGYFGEDPKSLLMAWLYISDWIAQMENTKTGS